jgi:hypothetical protein
MIGGVQGYWNCGQNHVLVYGMVSVLTFASSQIQFYNKIFPAGLVVKECIRNRLLRCLVLYGEVNASTEQRREEL